MSMFAPEKQVDTAPDCDVIINLIKEGRISSALRALQNSENGVGSSIGTAKLFALGVCFFKAAEYTAASAYFEKALIALKQSQPQSGLYPKSDTYRKLRKQELASRTYLTPFDNNFIALGGEQIKENIILALANSCFCEGNKDKAKTLVNSLVGEEFSEIKTLVSENNFFEKEQS
jgi:hypothetical protein